MSEQHLQPNDVNEFTQQMPYKGAARGAETPSTGYVAGTHYHITEKGRKDQLKDIGLETREEYIDAENESSNATKGIIKQRIKRFCFLFVAMFVLSMVVGMIVADFWDWGTLVGLGVGAGIGFVLFILPMIIFIITNLTKK